MRRRLLLAAPLAFLALHKAWAHSYKLGNIEIGNLCRSTERLVGGSTPIAKEVLLRDEDGSPLEYLELPPHHPLALRPGRRYIALLGLKGPLALDDSFPLTLRFEHAGEIAVTVMVEDGPEEG
jgi:periplasmic copper chaperone A